MPKIPPLSEPDVIELLKLWSNIGAATVQPTQRQGASNTTYMVDAKAGKFILKLYGDSTLTTQIQYEHSLLAYLHSADLSFAVPAPVPAKTGETLVLVNRNDTLHLVALQPLLSGQPADRLNPRHTRAAGQALGELHRVLAEFDPPGQLAQLPSWGDLNHIHPLVTDPMEVPQSLALTPNQQARLVKTLTEVLVEKPRLYKTLPVQTIHADYLSPHVLLESNRVVGVVDFEFATKDLRLWDYICGLEHFALFPWKEESHWQLVQAFSAGYSQQVSLTQREAEALTRAWRLQRASSIVYWTGWLREGKVTLPSVVKAVTETLLLEDWFEDNATKLLSESNLAIAS